MSSNMDMHTNGDAPTRALVTGAGGFIGHHLVGYLKDRGYWVRGVDLKEPEYEATRADEFIVRDLREADTAHICMMGIDEVYHLDEAHMNWIVSLLPSVGTLISHLANERGHLVTKLEAIASLAGPATTRSES